MNFFRRHWHILLLTLVAVLLASQFASPSMFTWLRGSVLPEEQTEHVIGRKNGMDVVKVVLGHPEDTATLVAGKIYLVSITPAAHASDQPLDNFFAAPASYYGYQYSDGAQAEKAAQISDEVHARFPGTFFASDEAKVADQEQEADHRLQNFEIQHAMQFRGTHAPETDAQGGPGKLYMIVLLTGTTTLRVPTPLLTCGNGTIDPDEQCDDGNTIDTDACTNFCRAPMCGDGICSDNGGSEGTNCDVNVGACTGVMNCPQDCVPDFPNVSSSDSSSSSCDCPLNADCTCAGESSSDSSVAASEDASSSEAAATCGNGVCDSNESAIGCDPVPDQPNSCPVFCPQDCSGTTSGGPTE